jgi:hypothetical protein
MKNMKERPILISAIILSIMVELIIIFLVYDKIGSKRLPEQSIRLLIEIILISLIIVKRSNTALLGLAGLHLLSGLLNWNTIHSSGIIGQILSIYHFAIALVIYFHDYLENLLTTKKT